MKPLVITIGCPSSIGPELSLRVAPRLARKSPVVLVGHRSVLQETAERLGVSIPRLRPWEGESRPGLWCHDPFEPLRSEDATPGKPSSAGGVAQLLYVEVGYALAQDTGGVLVTNAVSKEAVATCGLRRARHFRGHTEWLQELDGAPSSVMCFVSERLSCSLVTTHLPLRAVPRAITPEAVAESTVWLGRLLHGLHGRQVQLLVSSLNPHAGEGELLGTEEQRAIVPGMKLARQRLGRKATIVGPVGAETAFRWAQAGKADAVVAMYHDQATIPMKVLAFGAAVNVTMGLRVLRTSVDHGTGYDIAGLGKADPAGLLSAAQLAERMATAKVKLTR